MADVGPSRAITESRFMVVAIAREQSMAVTESQTRSWSRDLRPSMAIFDGQFEVAMIQ